MWFVLYGSSCVAYVVIIVTIDRSRAHYTQYRHTSTDTCDVVYVRLFLHDTHILGCYYYPPTIVAQSMPSYAIRVLAFNAVKHCCSVSLFYSCVLQWKWSAVPCCGLFLLFLFWSTLCSPKDILA